jgi:nucleolin
MKMLTMHDGRSKGVCFVKVGNKAALTSVLGLHKAEHMGRWLNVEESYGAPNKGNFITPEGNAGGDKEGDTVFVGNLSFTCTEESLRAGFESAGEIKAVRIAMRDGQPRGFGHVEFYDNAGAKKACELAGTYIDGRAIRVDISEKR